MSRIIGLSKFIIIPKDFDNIITHERILLTQQFLHRRNALLLAMAVARFHLHDSLLASLSYLLAWPLSQGPTMTQMTIIAIATQPATLAYHDVDAWNAFSGIMFS